MVAMTDVPSQRRSFASLVAARRQCQACAPSVRAVRWGMRIAVFGATGRIGSAVVTEARSRGHEVTAVVRGPRPAIPEGVTTVVAHLDDQDTVRAACTGHDVVVSAIGWTPGQPDDLLARAARALVAAVDGTPTRLLIVGGAGTLMTPGGRFLDSP